MVGQNSQQCPVFRRDGELAPWIHQYDAVVWRYMLSCSVTKRTFIGKTCLWLANHKDVRKNRELNLAYWLNGFLSRMK
jgi:hypothetical protein